MTEVKRRRVKASCEICLAPEQDLWLDSEATRTGKSRSEIVRDALVAQMKQRKVVEVKTLGTQLRNFADALPIEQRLNYKHLVGKILEKALSEV